MSKISKVSLDELYPRCCDDTGRGMRSGWYLGGIYLTDETVDGVTGDERLAKWVRENCNQTVDEFWHEIQFDEALDCEYYWTEWDELDDEFAYLENGTELIKKDDNGDWMEYLDEEAGIVYKVIP